MGKFIDESSASNPVKLRRVLEKLKSGSAVYFYDDGYPRADSIEQDAQASLDALTQLESQLTAERAANKKENE